MRPALRIFDLILILCALKLASSAFATYPGTMELSNNTSRIVSLFSAPVPICGRTVVANLQANLIAPNPTTLLKDCTCSQLAKLCVEFDFDVGEWGVLAVERDLMVNYFLNRASSVIDDPTAVRWHSVDKVAVTDEGIESIEGGQLLVPPSVVLVIQSAMAKLQELDEDLLAGVAAASISQSLPTQATTKAQPKTIQKRKKTTPKKGMGIETVEKRQATIEEVMEGPVLIPGGTAAASEVPSVARIPKKQRRQEPDSSSQVSEYISTIFKTIFEI